MRDATFHSKMLVQSLTHKGCETWIEEFMLLITLLLRHPIQWNSTYWWKMYFLLVYPPSPSFVLFLSGSSPTPFTFPFLNNLWLFLSRLSAHSLSVATFSFSEKNFPFSVGTLVVLFTANKACSSNHVFHSHIFYSPYWEFFSSPQVWQELI